MKKRDRISHELRTSLSVVREGVSLILDGVPGRLNEKQKAILIMVKRNIDRFEKAIVESEKG